MRGMVGLVSVVLVAAAPVKVAVPGFAVSGFDATQSDAWVDRFVTLLSADEAFKLTTSRDIAAVLGVERQRQLLGCSESGSSCLAELAGALGVDSILSGTIARSGSGITATVRVLKTNDGSQIAAVTGRVRDVDALQDWLDAQVPEVGRQLRRAFGLQQTESGPAPVATAQVTASRAGAGRTLRWLPVLGGAAVAIAGAVFYGLSAASAAQLRSRDFGSRDEIISTASAGRAFEGAGVGLLISGAVVLAAGLVWVLLGSSS